MEQLFESLERDRKIQIIKQIIQQQYSGLSLVRVDEKQYLMSYINNSEGYLNSDNLNVAHQQYLSLEQFDHPNILKFVEKLNSYLNYSLVLMEGCENSLSNWIKENKEQQLNRFQYIYIALQILETVEYIHSKKLYLIDFCLENILISDTMQIKFYKIGTLNDINHHTSNLLFLNSNIQEGFYYIPPESLFDQKIETNSSESYEKQIMKDIWSVGISLYMLAGASLKHVIQYTQGNEQYSDHQQTDEDISNILQQMLQREPTKRPSINKIQECFQQILKQDSEMQDIGIKGDEQAYLFNQSKELYCEMKFQESQNILLQLTEKYPNNDIYLAWLARTYAQLKDLNESFKLARKSLMLNKQNYLAYNVLGFICSENKEYDIAIENYKKALQINPTFLISIQNLGNAYKNIGQDDKSIETYKKCALINPNHEVSINTIGLVYLNQKEYELAETQFLLNFKKNPKQYHTIYNLGIVSSSLKNYSKSIIYFKKIIQFCDKNEYENSLNRLGNEYYYQSKYDKSLKMYKRAIQTNPTEVDFQFNLNLAKNLM